MKDRSYNFAQKLRKGAMRTKREIVDSLKQFARENELVSFTQKQYDAWPNRVLCSRQIAERFKGWACAMQQAALTPQWSITTDLTPMVELFMDCWEEHDDAPTVKALADFLKKSEAIYTVSMYSRYFGGVRRLANRIVAFQLRSISEAQLVERYRRVRKTRRPVPPSVRAAALKRDDYSCVRCHQGGPLEVHHIKWVAEGGSDDIDNLQTLCESCHIAEHGRLPVLKSGSSSARPGLQGAMPSQGVVK